MLEIGGVLVLQAIKVNDSPKPAKNMAFYLSFVKDMHGFFSWKTSHAQKDWYIMGDSPQSTLGLEWNGDNPDCYIVGVSGRLELTESMHLEKEVVERLRQEPRNILLNLKGIHFMSSSGIRALIAIMRTCKTEVCHLALCRIPPSVRKIMEVVEVAHLFEIYDTEEDALARLSS